MPSLIANFMIAFALLACCAVSCVQAQTVSPSLDIEELDQFIANEMQEKKLVGLSVAVVRDGKTVLAKGYGKTALRSGKPVTTETPFAVGSVTKQFTCACILLLAEEGKLSVNDPVAKYYPDLTLAKEITLLDLMNHVSGYRDYYPLDFVDRRMLKPITGDDLLKEYAGMPLDFAPGTRFSYTNTGYILLGRVVEKVSGEPLGKFMQTRIFAPLGMTHTVLEPKPSDNPLPSYVRFCLGEPELAVNEANGWIGGAGAIYSTPTDLAKWDLALIDGTLLKPESFRLMTTPRILKNGAVSNYGCGQGIQEREGVRSYGHGGAVSGFIADNVFVPVTRSAFIILTNFEDGQVGAIRERVAPVLMPPAKPLPTKAKPEPAPKPAESPKPEERKIPEITGVSSETMAYHLFKMLQAGQKDETLLGAEYAWFLTNARRKSAQKALTELGEPTKTESLSRNERGGMEVSGYRFHFANDRKVRLLMYRAPSGKVEQFFVARD